MFISASIVLGWCNQFSNHPTESCSLKSQTGNICTTTSLISTWSSTEKTSALTTAKKILQLIKNNDFKSLAKFIWPQGIRFSPYTYVNKETDKILSKDEILNWKDSSQIFIRWTYDGSWEPIQLSIKEYFKKFVYDSDFLNAPEIIQNQEIMRGNMINNIFDIYTGKYIIEFYIPGTDPKYEGMDWKSLFLVLEKIEEKRFLIWIIHNQRTI